MIAPREEPPKALTICDPKLSATIRRGKRVDDIIKGKESRDPTPIKKITF